MQDRGTAKTVTGGPVDRILWQRLDRPGLEWCEIRRRADETLVNGIALVADAGMPYRIEYTIEIDAAGRTRRAVIRPTGTPKTTIALEADEEGRWVENGVPIPDVAGCLDVDLGFSPMTNSLPIWRLRLAPGETREIRAAWVRFPELTVALLRQTYERAAESTYLYRSDGFEARLTVDDEGIVEGYGAYWRAVARQRGTG
jgi:hypothetical protein